MALAVGLLKVGNVELGVMLEGIQAGMVKQFFGVI